ncbi:MAG: hypothetical protein IT324_24945 [Anaerolineae bacterium]|nr:hypothetical protein [Anaerolineae bacterium]
MRRFFRLVLISIGSLALIILIGRLVGSAYPVPLAILLTHPDGLSCQRPCLFGIRPGITTMDQAMDLLRAHPFIRKAAAQEYTNLGLFGGGPAIVSLTPDENGMGRSTSSWIRKPCSASQSRS